MQDPFKRDRLIAEAILNAQIASDAGKSRHHFRHVPTKAVAERYEAKDEYVRKAIRLIVTGRHSHFRFAVQDGGSTPYLVYFEVEINGERCQVSFHSFDRSLEPYLRSRKKGRGRVAVWDHGSSRVTAAYVASQYGVRVVSGYLPY